ncbi:MAG: hypothetical protein IT370_21095 [Deltaproteobacteria bacterium]|nr:hypothetical protein [Deltaproteobacteria bacterium]
MGICMRRGFGLGLVIVASAGLALEAGVARADDNDLVLSRLGEVTGSGGVVDVIPDHKAFRALASELGVVMSPKAMSPADTMGYSGFQFSTEFSINTINGNSPYWRAAQGADVTDPAAPKFHDSIPTMGVFVRKGMWLPLPSFEVGAGALKLFDSNMWSLQMFAKFALHEGYDSWPLPSLAVRGSAARLMGTDQIDLTTAAVDVSMSKRFGVQGTWAAEPYAGGNMMWIIPRSEVVDATPNIDATQNPQDIRLNFVFPEQDDIRRIRFFLGMKFRYYLFSLTLEAAHTLAGSTTDVRVESGTRIEVKDEAGSQQTYSASLSMDL